MAIELPKKEDNGIIMDERAINNFPPKKKSILENG